MTAALKIRRIPLKAAISLAAMIAAAGMTATPAQAQLLGACPSIIMPPPCIIFDYKKLANWAQTHAQVLQQIQQVKSSIEQTQASVATIGQTVSNLQSINFQMPNIDATPSSLFGNTGSGIGSLAQGYATKVFAPTSQNNTLDGQHVAGAQVRAANIEADTDAWAQRVYAEDQIGKSQTDTQNLSKEVEGADTLQADWTANSHVKLALVAAMTQRSYLLSTFLKMQAAHETVKTNPAISSGPGAGTIAASTLTPVADTVTPLVKQLDALLAQASSLMASVQVVQLAQSNISQLQAEITDFNNTVAQNTALNNAFNSWAYGTSRHGAQIIGDTNTALANKDIEYANDRATPIDSSVNTYQFGRRGINPSDFTSNEVDPRQFLGTWADPIKGTLSSEISNYLTSGSLDDYLSGGQNDQFRAYVNGYMNGSTYVDGLYSLREEVAWKQSLVNGNQTDANGNPLDPSDPNYQPSVATQLASAQQTITDENNRQGFDVTTDAITQKLTDIVNQANALGSQISQSGNASAQQQAAQTLAELQQVVGNGPGLPAVDATSVISTDASGNDTIVAGSTDLTQYTTTPVTTTPIVTTGDGGLTGDDDTPIRGGVQP